MTVRERRKLEKAEEKRNEEKRKRQQELLPAARIEILGVAHAGVTLDLGSFRHPLDDESFSVRFRFDPESDSVQTDPLS